MGELRFVRFAAEHLRVYQSWFEDVETRRWMALPDTRWLEFVTTDPHNFAWMVYDAQIVVGQVQAGNYGTNPQHASLAIVIAPEHRRQHYGTRLFQQLVVQPELSDCTHYHGFVEPDNQASLALLRRIGFRAVSDQPDEEGFLEYLWSADVHHTVKPG